MTDKKTQGKKNRESGARFEIKVRKDLESKGWIVSKWMNNVEFICHICEMKKTRSNKSGICEDCGETYLENNKINRSFAKLIPAKRKWGGPGRPMSIGTGFPDFICFKCFYDKTLMGINFWNLPSEAIDTNPQFLKPFGIIGVEVKSNGILTKEERAKAKWYLDHNVFNKFLIAQKGEKRGEIKYVEFGE